MATVVSHAMRRYPVSPPDTDYSSYGFRSSVPGQTWSPVEEPESSLSRSMRYAEPWLYGSVRAPNGLVLAPALVLCSCADYINGTKRSSKKGHSICKKCKGSRIPLNNVESKFGTVRCYPTSPVMPTSCVRAGTVRTPSSKSRPSILGTGNDPYDLMRRSRLSVSDGSSQFRARSVSPNKTRQGDARSVSATRSKSSMPSKTASPTKYSTVGRKSILECNVNPYELMGNDLQPTDAGITLLNGQRIRVKPKIPESDYEDVQIKKTSYEDVQVKRSSNQKLAKEINLVVNGLGPPTSNEKESDYVSNRFKSILKKPTATFSDTDTKGSSNSEASSSSPACKSGSHFYLPLPTHAVAAIAAGATPRKKVQFLVEKENQEALYENEEVLSNCCDSNESSRDSPIEDDVFENYEEKDTSTSDSCRLRRSKSERVPQESPKVLFHDTMALRTKANHNDAREIFTLKDLEKLDGISLAKLKNFDKIRPRGPPPLPPPPQHPPPDIPTKKTKEEKQILSEPKKLDVNVQIECFPEKEEDVKTISRKTDDKKDAEIKYFDDKLIVNRQVEETKMNQYEQKLIDDRKLNDERKLIEEERIQIEENIRREQEVRRNELEKIRLEERQKLEDLKLKIIEEKRKQLEQGRRTEEEKKHNDELRRKDEKLILPITNAVLIQKNLDDLDKLINEEVVSLEIPDFIRKSSVIQPPSAPPRKRSNNKQPISNYQSNSLSNYQSIKIDESPNKTILRINSTEDQPVHKLKIRNEFPEIHNGYGLMFSDNNQGKTSIMINGDDCYCTVNVSDDVSIYQSSVVVKDSGATVETPEKKSSTVYITGNFTPVQNNKVKNKEIAVQVNGAENLLPDVRKVNALKITADKEEFFRNEEPAINQSPLQTSEKVEKSLPSAEMLQQLLNDPVEAVKRNLVPHVCGKSDVPRRPRNKKFIESNNLVASFLKDSLLNTPEHFHGDHVTQLIEESFSKMRNHDHFDDDKASEHSSSTQYEIMDPGSDCYTDNSNRSSVTEEELSARSKFYELLAESAVEVSEGDDHHYESIKVNSDPIYEEIEIPPPLPTNPPPSTLLDDLQLDKEYTTRSIFEGASKYDILSYLVDAKERGIVPEDSYTYNFHNSGIVVEEDGKERYNRVSQMSTVSDSSEESSLVLSNHMEDKTQRSVEVERNDSGVGSETSKSSLSKYRTKQDLAITCEDCDTSVENQGENEPLVCRKCMKKRSERKEIITEIVETEEKYSRDLQIILEEFYQPMLVAGLLTSDQLSAIFLNVEELLENSQALAERLRDAVEIALEQGDEDLLTVNIGKLILEAAPMLHAFETYCVRQGSASLLLASLEKEKELLRIFLRVSQMENTVLRRMNLNSFLMVPVQRVTKYPLLLARLYKVTSLHHETREQLKEAQHKIELHLNHMNSETKDVPSKLWRRISSSNGRRSSSEMDLVNIKLRKIAVDVLEWNHDEARFALEGKLLYTQPTDNNWRKGRTIKLTPVNALLVTNGKVATSSTRPEPSENGLIFSRHSGVREAALLLVRDKNGRYSLLREPLYLDRCVIAADPAWQSYFEVQELLGKDTFIFKADDDDQTKIWYRHLQYYAQGMGAWRKRRNALANIMINGMGLRS